MCAMNRLKTSDTITVSPKATNTHQRRGNHNLQRDREQVGLLQRSARSGKLLPGICLYHVRDTPAGRVWKGIRQRGPGRQILFERLDLLTQVERYPGAQLFESPLQRDPLPHIAASWRLKKANSSFFIVDYGRLMARQ